MSSLSQSVSYPPCVCSDLFCSVQFLSHWPIETYSPVHHRSGVYFHITFSPCTSTNVFFASHNLINLHPLTSLLSSQFIRMYAIVIILFGLAATQSASLTFSADLANAPAIRSTALTMSAPLTTITNTTIPAGHWLVVGPVTTDLFNTEVTLGYWIQSTSGRFNILIMSDIEYVKFQSGQPFQYYTAYSLLNVTSASFPSQSYTPPTSLYLVLCAEPLPTSAVSVLYNIGFFAGRGCFVSCRNTGICVAPGTLCSCTDGWGGTTCNIPVCSPLCNFDGGSCSVNNTCVCNNGWSGRICDTPPHNSQLMLILGTTLGCVGAFVFGMIVYRYRRGHGSNDTKEAMPLFDSKP